MTQGTKKPSALRILLHGESKAGKSTLADTAPPPRLHLDAEGGAGTDYTPSIKVEWDPKTQPPPKYDGSWETCVVIVDDYATFERAVEVLQSGKHHFRSVIVDSISEVQQRAIDSYVGVDQMQTQDWGQLLREVTAKIRALRDLTKHPVNPLAMVVMCAMTKEANGKMRPYVQGQLATRMPYMFDIVGWVHTVRNETGQLSRRLLVGHSEEYEAGERVGGCLGEIIGNPNLGKIQARVTTHFNNLQAEKAKRKTEATQAKKTEAAK